MSFSPEKGFGAKREKWKKTKAGLILYKGKGGKWVIDYPDESRRYGRATTIKVMELIYHIGHGKTLNEARRLVFGKEEY